MNELTYIIVKNESFNEFGARNSAWYIIKYRQYFLGLIPYWKYITHPSYDCSSDTTFYDIDDAKSFIKDVLCKGKPYNKITCTPISEVKCEIID